MSAPPINMRELAIALFEEVDAKWPGIVPTGTSRKIRESKNFFLDSLRVANECLKKAGVDTSKAVARARSGGHVEMSLEAMLAPEVTRDPLETGEFDLLELMRKADSGLANFRTRASMPPWFVNQFYPDLCSRLARGSRCSDRDLHILAIVTGELP